MSQRIAYITASVLFVLSCIASFIGGHTAMGIGALVLAIVFGILAGMPATRKHNY